MRIVRYGLFIDSVLSNYALKQFFDVLCTECDDCGTTVRTFCRKIAVFVNVVFDNALDLCSRERLTAFYCGFARLLAQFVFQEILKRQFAFALHICKQVREKL